MQSVESNSLVTLSCTLKLWQEAGDTSSLSLAPTAPWVPEEPGAAPGPQVGFSPKLRGASASPGRIRGSKSVQEAAPNGREGLV